jgi:dihydroflavonol-4-reductase
VDVLLTGASGFIGAHIADELARGGAKVRAFCRSEPPPGARVADWVCGDVTDGPALARAARGCEAVVHAAALYSYSRADAPAMEAINVEGTRNVLEAGRRAGIGRVLVTSTSATCGPVPGRPADEGDDPPRWELRVPYKRTKIEAERLAVKAGATCVNPTTVVGAGDRNPTPSGKMIRDLVEGRIGGYMRGGGLNIVAVEDVARGHALALERGRPGERYILGGDDLWLRDAFKLALKALGRSAPRLAIPWGPVYGAAVVADVAGRLIGREPQLLVLDEVRLARLPLFFSSAKARRELGYVPRPAADALAAAATWFGERRARATTSSAASGSWAV